MDTKRYEMDTQKVSIFFCQTIRQKKSIILLTMPIIFIYLSSNFITHDSKRSLSESIRT